MEPTKTKYDLSDYIDYLKENKQKCEMYLEFADTISRDLKAFAARALGELNSCVKEVKEMFPDIEIEL